MCSDRNDATVQCGSVNFICSLFQVMWMPHVPIDDMLAVYGEGSYEREKKRLESNLISSLEIMDCFFAFVCSINTQRVKSCTYSMLCGFSFYPWSKIMKECSNHNHELDLFIPLLTYASISVSARLSQDSLCGTGRLFQMQRMHIFNFFHLN